LIGLGVVLLSQFAEGFANGPPTRTFEGQAILARHCAKCHAIDNTSDSVLQQAPPLRDIFRRYPLERLEFELSEGIGSTHPDMPQIQFSTEQIDMIVKYLAGLNGRD
jgi:mono/diheme cytochrome c family protein